MAFYQYRQDNQSKFQPNQSGEPFLKIDKKKTFTLDTKQDSNSIIRILPPWSAEGLFALATSIHWRVGIKSEAFVCPNTRYENECLFCRTRAQYKGEWDKYKDDLMVISAKDRYYSNVINLQNPALWVHWYLGTGRKFTASYSSSNSQDSLVISPIRFMAAISISHVRFAVRRLQMLFILPVLRLQFRIQIGWIR